MSRPRHWLCLGLDIIIIGQSILSWVITSVRWIPHSATELALPRGSNGRAKSSTSASQTRLECTILLSITSHFPFLFQTSFQTRLECTILLSVTSHFPFLFQTSFLGKNSNLQMTLPSLSPPSKVQGPIHPSTEMHRNGLVSRWIGQQSYFLNVLSSHLPSKLSVVSSVLGNFKKCFDCWM